MLNIEVYHDSHDLNYRSPFGAVPCGTRLFLRIDIISQVPAGECFLRLWEKDHGKHLVNMNCREIRLGNKIKQSFEVEYPMPDVPGLVWYFFHINIGDKVYYYGNNGERLGGQGELQNVEPHSYQITVFRLSKAPQWFKDGVIYQIFVDRFCKGRVEEQSKDLVSTPSIAQKQGLLHLDWNDNPFYIKDEQGRVTRWNFFGGNLPGVMEKLDYLQELGISIIYFNPIFEASSNHKYDTADYLKIDTMFGDEDIFRRLVEEAKKRGISIILDGVFSHTGCDSIYFNRFGNYPEIGAYQSPDSPYAKWYTFIEGCDCTKYECWWGVDDLPNVDEMNPSYQYFIYGGEDSVVRHWLKAGVRGWRLDVADELPDEFIKELRHAVKETDPEAVLIGEVWEDASNKISYGKLREYLWGEELDSTMNYPFRSIFLDFILEQIDAPTAHKRIMSLYENYPRENFYAAMNLIGSHDRERVLTLLGEAPPGEKLTEKEKEEFRLDEKAREMGFKRLKILSLIQMTFPGVPCVYYGDETGMEGYADPYNRGTYPWGMEDQKILLWYQRIIRLRREYGVLRDGTFESFYQDRDVYGFRRIGDTEQIFVLVNRNHTEEKTLKADLVEETGYKDKVLILDLIEGTLLERGKFLTIPPLEGRIIYLKSLSPELPAIRALPKGCGILLHITSLPSIWGVGDMGEEAYRFVDFLAATGHTIWQILPLNPPGIGNSPYQSYSAFAGNDLLLDIGHLSEEGLLDSEEVREESEEIQKEIKDFAKASFNLTGKSKERLYRKAYQRFQVMIKEISQVNEPVKSAYLSLKNYNNFQQQHRFWLEDYCLYAALKKNYGGVPWYQWGKRAAERRKEDLIDYRNKFEEEISYQCFLQYTFFTQWEKLKNYTNSKGISILGDLPIYVSQDSSDVWVNRKLFYLDHEGLPSMVAGVPPDYFSKTGQLWGNPIYRWEEMDKEGYTWWIERVRHSLHMYDYLRLDHFRGFEAFWAVPGEEETAVNGLWLKGPGKKLFETLHKELGDLPFIAEDLGVITPEVNNLKHIFGFPGMMIFQFSSEEMLEEEDRNLVYYTGTHDNDTLAGWCREQPSTCHYQSIVEKLYGSDANWVIVPLQDILGLDSETRMNTPGTIYGNWEWRVDKSSLKEETREWLRKLTNLRT